MDMRKFLFLADTPHLEKVFTFLPFLGGPGVMANFILFYPFTLPRRFSFSAPDTSPHLPPPPPHLGLAPMSQPNFPKMRRNGSTSLIKQVRGKDSSQSMFSMIISLSDFPPQIFLHSSHHHFKFNSPLETWIKMRQTSALLEKKNSATIVA